MTPPSTLRNRPDPAPKRPAPAPARWPVAVVGIVLLLATGCTTGSSHTLAPTAPHVPRPTTAMSIPATPAGTVNPAGALPAGPFTMTGDIATPVGDPQVFAAAQLGAARISLPRLNDVGVVTTFAVVGPSSTPWIQVLLPTRPNGRMAWVPQSSVTITHTDLRVLVDLGGRRLSVQRAGSTVFEAQVAVGTTDNPTPTGATYVTELIQNADPNGSYGPYAYGLALFSPTLTEFAGGPGQVGIHGTNQPQLIGQRVSHGCVRLHNQDVRHLLDLQLPLGVPVFIT